MSLTESLTRSLPCVVTPPPIQAANGLAGPYQGMSGTLLRNLPAAAWYFGSNEYIKVLKCLNEGRGPLSMRRAIERGGGLERGRLRGEGPCPPPHDSSAPTNEGGDWVRI